MLAANAENSAGGRSVKLDGVSKAHKNGEWMNQPWNCIRPESVASVGTRGDVECEMLRIVGFKLSARAIVQKWKAQMLLTSCR